MTTRAVSTKESLFSAIEELGDGDEIIVEPGTYNMTKQVAVQNSGVTIRARNDAVVNDSDLSVLDFSGAGSNGVHIYADDVTIQGFEIRNTGKQGITTYVGGASFRSGDYPQRATILRCHVHHTAGYGLMLPGQDHHIQEVDSHYTGSNDPKTFGDGFQAGDGHNHTFVMCRAWDNRDDGWDLLNGTNMTLRHCYVFDNPGDVPDANPNGCTGFKLGIKDSGTGVGSGGGHYLERCVSYNNTLYGYSSNNSNNPSTLVNCTAWSNGSQSSSPYNFALHTNENGNPVDHVLKNCFSIDGTNLLSSSAIEVNNSWNLGLDNSPVRSKDPSDQWFLRPTADSPVIDAGTTSVDVEYSGSAPDLGAFEFWNAPKGGYSTPAEGTLDWDDPLNDNFEAIEQDLEMIADRIQSLRGEDISPPSLETPAEGTLDWHIPLNDNFEAISTAVENLSAEAEAVGASVSVTEEYNTPAEGTLDWHVPLNDNFDNIEASVVNLTEEISARE